MANMIFKLMDISGRLRLGDDVVSRFYLLEIKPTDEIEDPFVDLNAKVDALTAKVDGLRALIFGLYRPHLLPGKKLSLALIGETRKPYMASFVDFLTYEADLAGLASLGATDVEKQVLTVRSSFGDTEESTVVELARDATKAVFEVRQDSVVRLALYYVDDAGNRSGETYSQEFVARDTIAPEAPGDFGAITLTGERRVEVADAPEPPAEPAPSEPAPVEPAPVDPAPVEEAPAPSEPEVTEPEVVSDPAPVAEAPAEPAPEAPEAPVEALPEPPAPEPVVTEEPVVEPPVAPEEPVADPVVPEAPVEEAPAEAPAEVPAVVPVEEPPVVEEPVVEAPVEPAPVEEVAPAEPAPPTEEAPPAE